MWGSWIGAVILASFNIMSSGKQCSGELWLNCSKWQFQNIRIFEEIIGSLNFWITCIIGFLIGWGIHSSFRKMKK